MTIFIIVSPCRTFHTLFKSTTTKGVSKLYMEITLKSWFLLRVKPKQDKRAVAHLEEQNHQCFAPEISSPISNEKTHKLSYQPLFPGYVFIRLNSENSNWRAISSTRGVLYPVSFGHYPVKIPPTLMDNILYSVPAIEDKITLSSTLKTGDKIRITERSFNYLDAIYLSKSGEERSIVLINLLSKNAKVKVKNTSIERA
jgi:transcriptional antiterminator RfaH